MDKCTWTLVRGRGTTPDEFDRWALEDLGPALRSHLLQVVDARLTLQDREAFGNANVRVGMLGEFPALISGLEEQLSEEVDLRNEARSVVWFEHLRQTMDIDLVQVPLPGVGSVSLGIAGGPLLVGLVLFLGHLDAGKTFSFFSI